MPKINSDKIGIALDMYGVRTGADTVIWAMVTTALWWRMTFAGWPDSFGNIWRTAAMP